MSAPPLAQSSAPPLGPTRRRSIAVGLFVVWTVFVWAGRIRNALADDQLTSSERTTSLLLAGGFIAVAAVVSVLAAVAAARPSSRPLAVATAVCVGVAATWTTGVWISRIIGIAGGDWSVGFVIVHAVLAVISTTLAVWALVASIRPLTTKPG